MAEAAVEDVSLRYAAAHRGQAGLHLGDHPGREPGQQPLQFRRGELADHLGRRRPVPVQPGHVGEHHQLGRAERHRERGRRGVRVHVVGFAVPARGHAGDDRNPAVGQQRLDGTAVGGHDLSDHADVHWFTVDDRRLADRGERAGVFARHAQGERAVPVDQPDQVLVHLAGQDHPDDLHGFRRGDPEAGGEGGLDPLPVEFLGDLRAPAVHDDRAQPGVAEEDQILGEGQPQRVLGHRVPAVLDHDRPAVKPGQPGQCLHQRRRLGGRVLRDPRRLGRGMMPIAIGAITIGSGHAHVG